MQKLKLNLLKFLINSTQVQGGDLHNRVKIIYIILEITTKMTIDTTGKTFDMVDAELHTVQCTGLNSQSLRV